MRAAIQECDARLGIGQAHVAHLLAILRIEGFSEVAEEHFAAADLVFCAVADDFGDVPKVLFDEVGIVLLVAVDEEVVEAAVGCGEEQNAVRNFPVASGAPRFLIIILDGLVMPTLENPKCITKRTSDLLMPIPKAMVATITRRSPRIHFSCTSVRSLFFILLL